jgi:transglutaminase-like putative cysteine protease
MSIHIALHHKTHYRYDRSVVMGPQVVRLRPAPHCRTRILSYSLHIAPEKHFLNWQQDPQSNFLARIVLPEPTNEFVVEVDLVAEMAVLNPFDFFLEPEAEAFPFKYDKSLEHDLAPFQLKGPPTPFFMKFLGDVKHELLNGAGLPPAAKGQGRRTMDFLVALNQRLWRDIKYLIRLEPGVQTPEQTLAEVSGSCRDSA